MIGKICTHFSQNRKKQDTVQQNILESLQTIAYLRQNYLKNFVILDKTV